MSARIASIEAHGLLGAHNVRWELSSGVNILSGGNGSGKSTLLRAVVSVLQQGKVGDAYTHIIDDLTIETVGGDINGNSVIANFDVGPADFDALGRVSVAKLTVFYDILDRLFAATGKRVLRNKSVGEVRFDLARLRSGAASVELGTAQLSSGERSVLQLFASILVTPDASVLILDEPEISLSVEWQKELLDDILSLNEDLQILVATHSPAIVMKGWVDRICEIDTLFVK